MLISGSAIAKSAGRDATSCGSTSAVLSLQEHSGDVAACFAALVGYSPLDKRCAGSLLRRRLARLTGHFDLTRVQCARLTVLAGLHDFGKANRGFQCRIRADTSKLNAGHLAEAMGLLCKIQDGQWFDRLDRVFDFASFASWFEDRDIDPICFLASALSHHGSPVRPNDQATATLWNAHAGYAPLDEINALMRSLRTWLPEAWNADGEPISKAPPLQHAFCGLLQLADWIGSDTRLFPFPDERDIPRAPDRWEWSCRQALQAIAEIGFGVEPSRRRLGQEPGFDCLFPAAKPAPRPMQRAVGQLAIPSSASVTLIEDETGAGKTEAAFWHFLRLFAAGQVDGMYFALPTRAAALQIFERVRNAWRAACGPDAPAAICAVPGYLRADDSEGRKLPGFEVLWNDDSDSSRRHRHRYWSAEHPKRYLAGCVVVGTIDQVLLSALAVRHHHLRAAPLLRHLLVVDEVHASDAYMSAVLRQVLRRQVEAGGHVLLLSATLGAVTATGLLNPTTGTPPPPPSIDDAIDVPYPRLSVGPLGQTLPAIGHAGRRREVEVECVPHIDRPDVVAALALQHASAGARVLVIRNTVTGCLAVWRAIEAAPQAHLGFAVETAHGRVRCPHHGRFARPDRVLLDRGLEKLFGKKARRGPEGRVLVATQTVEQSLDIDADILITDLCPGDVLLQRLGRLHRHERERPTGYHRPTAIVLTPADADLSSFIGENGRTKGPAGVLGFGSVYDDVRVLQATWETLLEPEFSPLRIPEQNRAVVERCTHPQALQAIDQRGELWKRHGMKVMGTTIQNRQMADLNLLPWDVRFEVWEPSVLSRLGVLGQLEQKISTRLGLEDRRLALPKGTTGPFGIEIRELSFPGHWFARRPLPMQEEPDEITCKQDGSLTLRVGDWTFTYSACGLERARED